MIHTRFSLLAVLSCLALGMPAMSGCDEIESICKDRCKHQQKCEQDFELNYDSLDDCRLECETEMELTEAFVSDACWGALMDYTDCAVDLRCNEDPEEECANEHEDFVDTCEVEDDGPP